MTKKNKLNRRWLKESERFNFKNPTIEFFTEMFKDGIEKLAQSDMVDKYMKKLIKDIEKDYDEWGGGTSVTLDEVAEFYDDDKEEYDYMTDYVAKAIMRWLKEGWLDGMLSLSLLHAHNSMDLDFRDEIDIDKLHLNDD